MSGGSEDTVESAFEPSQLSPVAFGVQEWLISDASGHSPKWPFASSPLNSLAAMSLNSSPCEQDEVAGFQENMI